MSRSASDQSSNSRCLREAGELTIAIAEATLGSSPIGRTGLAWSQRLPTLPGSAKVPERATWKPGKKKPATKAGTNPLRRKGGDGHSINPYANSCMARFLGPPVTGSATSRLIARGRLSRTWQSDAPSEPGMWQREVRRQIHNFMIMKLSHHSGTTACARLFATPRSRCYLQERIFADWLSREPVK